MGRPKMPTTSLHDDEFRVRTTREHGEAWRIAAHRAGVPPSVLMRMVIDAVLDNNQKNIDAIMEIVTNDDCF